MKRHAKVEVWHAGKGKFNHGPGNDADGCSIRPLKRPLFSDEKEVALNYYCFLRIICFDGGTVALFNGTVRNLH